MSEILLPLRVDQDSMLVLGASSFSSWLAAGIFAALSLGIGWMTPDLQAAPLLFAGLSLWQAAQSLKTHELRLDGERRHMTYVEGWRFRPPIFSGPYISEKSSSSGTSENGLSHDLEPARLELRIESHQGDPGLVTSHLRGHKLVLSCRLPHGDPEDSDPLIFRVGYPMGPKAAEERIQDLSKRLGLPPTAHAPSASTPELADA